jgi:hypothetical protein
MHKYMTWEEAIVTVLAEEGGALPYDKIAARILKKNLRPATPTPTSTISSVITVSIRRGNSRFRWVGHGLYTVGARRSKRKSPVRTGAGENRASA